MDVHEPENNYWMNGEKKRSRCCGTKTIRKSTEKKQLV